MYVVKAMPYVLIVFDVSAVVYESVGAQFERVDASYSGHHHKVAGHFDIKIEAVNGWVSPTLTRDDVMDLYEVMEVEARAILL